MGCTHYIIDKEEPVEFVIICHDCGRKVDPKRPHLNHETCMGSIGDDDDLAVDIEIKNTRER